MTDKKKARSVGSLAEKREVLDNSPDDETGSYNYEESAEYSTQSTSTCNPTIHLMVPNQQDTEVDEILEMTDRLAKDEAFAAQPERRATSKSPKAIEVEPDLAQASNILRSSFDSKSLNWGLSSETSFTVKGTSPPVSEYSPEEKNKMKKKKLLARAKSNKQTFRKNVPTVIRELGRSWRRKSLKKKLKASGEEKVDIERCLSSSITSINSVTTTSESSSWDCSDETDSTTYFEDSLNLDTADVRHKERKVMRRRIRHKNYGWQRGQGRASDDLFNALTDELVPLDDDGEYSNTDLVEDLTIPQEYGANCMESPRSFGGQAQVTRGQAVEESVNEQKK